MSKIELNNEAWNRRLRFVDDAHSNCGEDQFSQWLDPEAAVKRLKSGLDTSHIPTEYVRAWDDAQKGRRSAEHSARRLWGQNGSRRTPVRLRGGAR